MRTAIEAALRHSLTLAVFGASAALSGCFFDQVEHSEENDIHRVEQKQAILKDEQATSAKLKQQEDQLAADLAARQLTLNDLTARVEAINAENGRAIAANEAARAKQQELLSALHQTNQELAQAQHGDEGSIDERNQRIAALKARLKSQLDVLLQ